MSKTFSTQPYKGTRDFYPDQYRKRDYIFSIWKKVMVENSFEEYDTSIIENAELYIAKSGEELGSTQLYSFEDKAKRKIALRPEMTPSLARIVANKFGELKFPLRWFSIPNCFRYERPQKGRTREFWQLNFDIIGADREEYDLEIIILLGKLFRAFGAKKEMFTIRYSHRKALDSWIKEIDLEFKKESIYKVLDDWHKTNEQEKQIFLREKGLNEVQIESVFQGLSRIREIAGDLPEIKLIQQLTSKILLDIDYQFDPTIVRGLAYYTGLVFEAFDNHPENNRAMFGGGRYDDLLDLFEKKAQAIGVGVGDLTWIEFLENWNLFPDLKVMEKVGILLKNRDSLTKLYEEILPELVENSLLYEVNYEYNRSENKRYQTLKKRGCNKVIII